MKTLPKRKKSPEELAKLRENLGILPPPPNPRPQHGQLDLAQPADFDDLGAAPLPNVPLPPRDRSQWRSLKQSELRVQPEIETPPEPATDLPAPFGLPRTPLIPVAQPQKLKPLRPLQPAATANATANAAADAATDSIKWSSFPKLTLAQPTGYIWSPKRFPRRWSKCSHLLRPTCQYRSWQKRRSRSSRIILRLEAWRTPPVPVGRKSAPSAMRRYARMPSSARVVALLCPLSPSF